MTDSKKELPFWKAKPLSKMSREEWESLCDGCGQCCLHKLEDVDTGAFTPSNVACRYFDLDTCSCTDYPNRQKNVPDCIQITPRKAKSLRWLPETCAYRLLAHGMDLAWWHPLVSGRKETVAEAGIAVAGDIVSEEAVNDLEEHIMNWIDAGNDPFNTVPQAKKKP